jgi:ketosteroid isomerase-like protein
MTPHASSPDPNVAPVRAGFDALNRGDLEGCAALAAPDLVMNLAGAPDPLHGRELWRQNAEEWICSDVAGLMRQLS